ncbi:putative glycolipid-binding domain-containing protein [Skermanella mucosa]|uniref:putative glycolipid-binding domain-containing protein n=1 Tax=Skermanella mucosa TaxID=1789672 RepID=UPI00192B65A6|nr:putative glycolipid-binding domain-containing protein [Skermanella mucosa]UEM18738.1 putative glycolipid-binding domain-containing protein [Skermanella mucosa]
MSDGRTLVARWRDWAGTGLEHLVLQEAPRGIVAEATVIATPDGGDPLALTYRISCDPAWRVRTLEVRLVGSARSLHVAGDGAGSWTTGTGTPLGALQGAIDVDLAVTPFTNTLPIRRLGLRAGESAEILAAYVSPPDLTVTPNRQRYTCLEPGRRYRYESVDGDFVRDVEVDCDGLVTEYPDLFRRVT